MVFVEVFKSAVQLIKKVAIPVFLISLVYQRFEGFKRRQRACNSSFADLKILSLPVFEKSIDRVPLGEIQGLAEITDFLGFETTMEQYVPQRAFIRP